MKFSCLQSELSHHLSLVSRAVPSRPSRPVLGNVLIMADAKQQTVTLVASDEVLGIESRFPAEVEAPGNLTLPAKLWGDLISRLPNEAVHIEADVDETTVIITSSPGRYKIRGLGAEDYPSLPTVEDGDAVSLSAESLLYGLERSLFAVSNDETKQVLTGVHWLSDEDTLKFVATDGHRLAEVQMVDRTGKLIPPMKMTIPAKALRELAHTIKAHTFTGIVQVRWDDTQVLFDLGGLHELTTRLLEGQYPNYRDSFPKPKKLTRHIILNRDELIKSLNRIAVLTSPKDGIAKFSLNSVVQRVNLSVEVQGVVRGREDLAAQMMGDDLDIAFNISYLLDGLKAFNSQQVQMRCSTATSPAILSPLGDANIIYLVMPVQIRNGEPEDLDDENLEDLENEELEDLENENLDKLDLDEADWLEAIEVADLEDEREKDLKLVVIREGQAAFRENLLSAYDGRCAITDCSVKDVLEAAHIVPYLGVKTNHLSNGLILRSDLHKLFDSFKIAINPDTLIVCVAPELMETEYRELNGKPLRKVRPKYPPVSESALRHHFNQCLWIKSPNSC